MKELLKQWAELCPDECRIIENGLYYEVNSFPNVLVIETRDWHMPIILGATMQAIEARGWDWCLGYGDSDYLGDVFTKRGDSRSEDTFSVFDKSPAHALLSAYLQAVKSTKEVS